MVLAVRAVFTRSEIVIGGSRGVFSIVIVYRHGLHSCATPWPRSTSFYGSELCVSTSPAKKLTIEGSVPAISGYCSYLLSWTDSSDQWCKYDFSKNLWLRRGNVVDRSLCLSSALASLSNLVKLIYLNDSVKVVRPSLATAIHTQQLLNLLYSLVPCSHLSNVVMDSKMEIPSKKYLGKDGRFYLFGTVNGAMPPMSSKSRHHRSENPTSANARQIQSVAWSLLMLEDCSHVALIEKANQTSSCWGHERSFHSFILFVEVNLSIKTPLHKRYFSLGFKAKEYYSFPSRLISCVMVRLGPEDTMRLIPMRSEVLELSTSRFIVTISEFEKFEGRCIYSMSDRTSYAMLPLSM
ncbi:hypothetical protein YC2023_075962 [Brassica napus]